MFIRSTLSPASLRLAGAGRGASSSLLCLALLTGCGGGSAATPPPAAAAASQPVANAVSSMPAADCGLAAFQAELTTRMNQWRAAGANCRTEGVYAPAVALTWNASLQRAGLAHSQDMAVRNYFSHTGADGSTPGQRITAVGYDWYTIGENIAAGYPSAIAVIDAWMASDGHCKNLMNPAFTEVGVACVPGTAADTYNTYWSMELAKPLK